MSQPPQPTPAGRKRGVVRPAVIVVDEAADSIRQLRQKYESLAPFLDERMRRLWAGAEAHALGRGGITAVAQATGLSRATVRAGIQELEAFRDDPARVADLQRVRRPGAGRRALTDTDPTLLGTLEGLFSPPARGPQPSPLRWTCDSTARLAGALARTGHRVTSRTVAMLLRQLGYTLRCPRGPSGDREQERRKAQFQLLTALVEDFLGRGQPVIAVDGMKTEGDAPSGTPPDRQARPAAQEAAPAPSADPPEDEGSAVLNSAWEALGADRVLAEFAVDCVWRWWRYVGVVVFPGAVELLLVADLSGGHAGFLRPLMQRLADAIGLPVKTAHHPPGTSKWTRAGYQMFCRFSSALPGQAPATYGVRMSLIGDQTIPEGSSPLAAPEELQFFPDASVLEEEPSPRRRGEPSDVWNCTFRPRGSAEPASPSRLFEEEPPGAACTAVAEARPCAAASLDE